jgi:hypothetical protein
LEFYAEAIAKKSKEEKNVFQQALKLENFL